MENMAAFELKSKSNKYICTLSERIKHVEITYLNGWCGRERFSKTDHAHVFGVLTEAHGLGGRQNSRCLIHRSRGSFTCAAVQAGQTRIFVQYPAACVAANQ